MGIESGRRKIINHDFVQGQENPPSCQRFARLGKPRRGLQIFDTRVDSLSLNKVVVDSYNLRLHQNVLKISLK